MKYARCPKCQGRLGIPSKKKGLPVECPKCGNEFVAPDQKASKKEAAAPNGKKKPSLRALPMPSAIASKSETPAPVATPTKAKLADDLSPPKPAKQLDAFAPVAKSSTKSKVVENPLEPPARPSPVDQVPPPAKSKLSSDMLPPGSTANLVDEPPIDPVEAVVEAKPTKKDRKSKRTVASIIKTESIQPQLTKDGQLPSLQLNDDLEAKPEEEKKSNPVVLTAIICVSLLSSGMMLLMLGGEKSDKQERIEKTRKAIRVYYEIRPDQDLKPYQIDLRQAQLAHSRGDYDTEIRAYENVMYRFRSEDLSEFSGLTGSPTSDRELEKWVSILLNEAKRQAKR